MKTTKIHLRQRERTQTDEKMTSGNEVNQRGVAKPFFSLAPRRRFLLSAASPFVNGREALDVW